MSVTSPQTQTTTAHTSVPDGVAQPQDHRAPAPTGDEKVFRFAINGKDYAFTRPTDEVLTLGFLRRNRHDETDMTFTLIERLADDDTLEAIDSLYGADMAAFQKCFGEHIQAVMGATLGN